MTPPAPLPGLEHAVVRTRRARRGAPGHGSLLDRLIEERSALRGRRPAVVPDTSQVGGRLSLDDVIVGAWEGLLVQTTTSCPVCGGAMAPSAAGQDDTVGGTCHDCGTSLG